MISNISTAVVIGFLIILKIVELILKQMNQSKNFVQQNEKIKIMNEQMSVSEAMNDEELTKKINSIIKQIQEDTKELKRLSVVKSF